MEAYGHFVIVV